MRFLITVGCSPWGSSLATAALRFTQAVLDDGDEVGAVFFNGDGVYNAVPGELSDGGGPSPQAAWRALARRYDVALVLCPAARSRRLEGNIPGLLSPEFSEGGLVALFELMATCDRVVGF